MALVLWYVQVAVCLRIRSKKEAKDFDYHYKIILVGMAKGSA